MTLVEKWGTRRRQLAKEAKSADAILAAETCKPPGVVTEKVVSLEEVELALPVECGPDRVPTPPRSPLVEEKGFPAQPAEFLPIARKPRPSRRGTM